MRIISKIIVGTSCLTIFAGTAYVTAITLAPPPNYTVSNSDRLKSYDKLSINNAYEKKTKSQEFYLGLSRWRRKMLKEEGVLEGRVLEIGAGCGGNLAYYPSTFLTDDEETLKYLNPSDPASSTAQPGSGENNTTSLVLQHIKKYNYCDEVVLCDRSPGMVESCANKIQTRLGYTPYRYPDYSIEGIRSYIRGRGKSAGGTDSSSSSGATVKRRIHHEDGTVQEVLTTPLQENDESQFLNAETDDIVPILQDISPGDKLPLLSPQGEEALRQRQSLIDARQSYRRHIEDALQAAEDRIIRRREKRLEASVQAESSSMKDTQLPPSPPAPMRSADGSKVTPQPLFSVANYAAEQLPFPDNSFDTVVDMFGLCSYDDPVRALREMSRVCRPGGKLLLIEHGRGSTSRVNNHLDKWAPRHAKNWGCWWNRDIRRVIRLSGLSVERWDNKHFGTSHYIIAKPYKSMLEWDAFHASQKE